MSGSYPGYPTVIFCLLVAMTISQTSLVFGNLGSFEDYLSYIYRLFLNFSLLGFSWARGRKATKSVLMTSHEGSIPHRWCITLVPGQLAEVEFVDLLHHKVIFFSLLSLLDSGGHCTEPILGEGVSLFSMYMFIQSLLFTNTDLLISWLIIKYYIVSIIA